MPKKTYEVTVWFESFAWATREIEAESPEAAAKIADDDAGPWFNDSEDGEPNEEPQFIRVTDPDTEEEHEFDRDPVRLEFAQVKAERDALLAALRRCIPEPLVVQAGSLTALRAMLSDIDRIAREAIARATSKGED